MIEIIREESLEHTEKRELPKDIKQIGRPDIGDRIYVENQVYQFLHAYENVEEKTAYVLLGRFENFAGKQCTFIEAAIRLGEIAFEGDMPVWNDQTWAYIYKQLRNEYDSMVIVGWAMDIKGQLPNMTVRIEALHQNNFGGEHQILLLMDTLEQEESFYGSRGGHLYRREGFYIYYEKHVFNSNDMEEQNLETKWSRDNWKEEEKFEDITGRGTTESAGQKGSLPRGKYRNQMFGREERQPVPSFASSLLLAVVVCALGVTAYVNQQKMNQMEATIAQINNDKMTSIQLNETQVPETQKQETQVTKTEQEEKTVAVETVKGNAVKSDVAEENTQQSAGAENGEMVGQTTGSMEQTVSQLKEEGTDESTSETAAPSADGTVQAAETTDSEKPLGTAEVTASSEETEEISAKKYLEQGYYIVQKGDSLVSISRKIYQTTAMLDKLCEVNKIENKDAIYAGQYLTLPH